mmetsp:Transcript_20472/g.46345  ORF Transcript_20472/g.46345 Transcript_20472/m.46345 type:complete len:346 (+) Transcript_20472:47-1084(+)
MRATARLRPDRLRRLCASAGVAPRALALPLGRRFCRGFCSFESGGTSLGTYLQQCGAVWGEAYEVEAVEASSDWRFSWRVAMPPERLSCLRPGDMLESPTFPLPGLCRGRFQLFPKGENDEMEPGYCSLWFCADAPTVPKFRLRLGTVERTHGEAAFCRLEDALRGDVMELSLQLEDSEAVAPPLPDVEQSLHIKDLQTAEWSIFQASRLKDRATSLAMQPVSSPPFRFHHVLLGDMYLELVPGAPSQNLCALMFRCRVPGLALKVSLRIGENFLKTIVAKGKATIEEDLTEGSFLQVNLNAPGVLEKDGSLPVVCTLEEVVSMPRQLAEMIPKLDERVNWPKRI